MMSTKKKTIKDEFPPNAPGRDEKADEDEDEDYQPPGQPANARKPVKAKRKISGVGSSFGDVTPGMQVSGGKIQSW